MYLRSWQFYSKIKAGHAINIGNFHQIHVCLQFAYQEHNLWVASLVVLTVSVF